MNPPPVCKPPSVGGQAVLEGVMMRSPAGLAVAVRNRQGEIRVRDQPWRSLAERWRFLRWPFLRGALVLGESMHNGMSALSFSADVAAEDEAREEARKAAAETPPADGTRPAAEPAPRKPPSFGWILIPSLLFALAVFKGVPHLTALLFDSLVGGSGVRGVPFHLVDGLAKLLLFVGYILLISRLPDIRRVFAYHGAEHKAIATVEAGLPLTVENARGHSRFHARCGTAFLLYVILIGVLLYMLVLPFLPPLVPSPVLNQVLLVVLKILLLFPIAGLSYEAIRLSGRHAANPLVRLLIAPGLWMQRLVTREPTDDQLEVALVSMEVALAREAEVQAARSRGEPATPGVREAVFAGFAAFRAEADARGGR